MISIAVTSQDSYFLLDEKDTKEKIFIFLIYKIPNDSDIKNILLKMYDISIEVIIKELLSKEVWIEIRKDKVIITMSSIDFDNYCIPKFLYEGYNRFSKISGEKQ